VNGETFLPIDLLTASGRLVRVRTAASAEVAGLTIVCGVVRHAAGAGAVHLVAEMGGMIVAALTLLREAEGYVAHLCVRIEERGDAIGSRLLDQARSGLGIEVIHEVIACR
jgi:hypothetical protein